MVIDVSFVENLENIFIHGSKITKLFDLRLAKKLKNISLYLDNVSCYDILQYATFLQEVSIRTSKIDNFTFLEKLNNFRRIEISTFQKMINFPQRLLDKYKDSILKEIDTCKDKIKIVKYYRDLSGYEKHINPNLQK